MARWAPALLSAGAFLLCGLASAARAQSALAAEVVSSSRGFTASRSSGLSFEANGTLPYTGPINELRPIPLLGATTLVIGERTVMVRADDALIQSRMPAPQGPGNTLSSELATSTVPAGDQPRLVQIGYAVIVPTITRVSDSTSLTRFEQVDGQSLSIFPGLSPSVFP